MSRSMRLNRIVGRQRRVFAIIPARDEEAALPGVLEGLSRAPVTLESIVVVDNGSRDRTAHVASSAGAEVVSEPRRGYGAACLRGIAALAELGARNQDLVLFVDGDGSDDLAELDRLVGPVERGEVDFALGSRLRRADARGAIPIAARFGNALATGIMRWLYGGRFSDLGPLRAIRYDALISLGMCDRTWGWTLEMQLRVLQQGLRWTEIPVRYRARAAGRSKVSGSVWGSLRAGSRILWVLGRTLWGHWLPQRG